MHAHYYTDPDNTIGIVLATWTRKKGIAKGDRMTFVVTLSANGVTKTVSRPFRSP